ncbi:hypothetical protein Gogos_000698 [Gossypium gossypioides]|uniref:S-acyltransferase n=1 Tax=Gossypium gossypioides TaxID=34282 RepID=A0A7J9CTG6_GOSGO|nr:hypothetical protein [Gossypium gossypioides]
MVAMEINAAKGTRTYQVWPGNNVTLSSYPRGLFLTSVSILISTWIFTIYIANDLQNTNPTLVITISLILTIVVIVNLILVTAIDPGIIPRSTQQSSVEDTDSSNGSRRKKRNYRFYLAFLITALVFFIYIFAFSCWRIHQRMLESGTGLFGMLRNCPETLALTLFSFAAIWFLGGLAIFHSSLTAINQTAYENFRNRYEGSPNPYDKGIISNITEVLFAPLPPYRVDFRAEAMPRWNVEDEMPPLG